MGKQRRHRRKRPPPAPTWQCGRLLPPYPPPRCACASPLLRPILDVHPFWDVDACLRCAQILAHRAVTEEPHPHHVVLVAYQPLLLDGGLGAWLGAFPRRIGADRGPVGDATGWLPAGARYDDEAALLRAEAQARADQAPLGLEARLVAAGGAPAAPPPVLLPDELHVFTGVQALLAIPEDAPIEALLRPPSPGAWVGPLASRLVADRIARRP